MPYFLAPLGNAQSFDSAGNPLVGGSWRTFLAGTTTPATTFNSQAGSTPQGTTMTLDAMGLPVLGPVWMLNGQALKFRLHNAAGVQLDEWDNVSGIGDTNTAPDEWVLFAAVPTYVSATSFTLAGDQTNTFQAKRRLKSTNTGGIVYSTIVSSVFTTVTTVTVANTSGVLDAGLSAVSYGLLAANNSSIPSLFAAQGANIDITSLGNNTSTVYTTAGTATAYTITPSPAITAYAIGQSFVVNFALASGTSPTLQISGIATPPSLVKANADGTYSNIAAADIPAGHRSRVTLISTTQALIERMAGFSSTVRLNTANGYGSTNTVIRRFTNVVTNVGADITYADSATLGATFTINAAGVYTISYNENLSVAGFIGLTLNTTTPTTAIFGAVPIAQILAATSITANGYSGFCGTTARFSVGDVIRAHNDGTAAGGSPTLCQFTITRVA